MKNEYHNLALLFGEEIDKRAEWNRIVDARIAKALKDLKAESQERERMNDRLDKAVVLVASLSAKYAVLENQMNVLYSIVGRGEK